MPQNAAGACCRDMHTAGAYFSFTGMLRLLGDAGGCVRVLGSCKMEGQSQHEGKLGSDALPGSYKGWARPEAGTLRKECVCLPVF